MIGEAVKELVWPSGLNAMNLQSGALKFKSYPDSCLDLFHGYPEFKSFTTMVSSQLVAFELWILGHVMFDLDHLF